MKLDKIRRLAAQILKTGKSKIYFEPNETDKAGEAITKEDVRELISEGIIKKRKTALQSRARARTLHEKKKKGRKRGFGKRTGKASARIKSKKQWVQKVRAQRRVLRELRKKNPKEVEKAGYRGIYRKIKGNFFRGKKYIEAAVKEKGA